MDNRIPSFDLQRKADADLQNGTSIPELEDGENKTARHSSKEGVQDAQVTRK